jgi:hypothetical protein
MADERSPSRLKALLSLDWDILAGIVAAVAALVMHFLHIVEEDVLLVIAVALLALRFFRDLRNEEAADRLAGNVDRIAERVSRIDASLTPPDIDLVGPRRLGEESEAFSRRASGDMLWFHVCLVMFKPQTLFDRLLGAAIDNPKVRSVRFVLDSHQRELWDEHVAPKVARCAGRDKVREPTWTTIQEQVSVIVSEASSKDRAECLMSFWGEPFMSRLSGKEIPRYVFRVRPGSELLPHLTDLTRKYQLSSG